uniref:FIST domain-containing protein n=1 Tax=Tetradesmus obliquus TaxID=3088 RepID=A0A383WJK7_TETOB|eukprot:jgi/Sobl393_1/9800/SZX77304.1
MSTDDDTMMLDEACLLDVPDELLKLIVAASTGQGVAAMSCACKRLRAVAKQLQASPIMCSAMSTDNDLHVAIREATHRAMAGSWGAADFALIFVANYGLPKKYTDPGDASHAVDMLREVLGKDIPIVGCACSGIMGVGADSRPAEVDPSMAGSSSSSRRAKGGPATRGVTVLLGKVPAGCAVRAFAAAQGPAAADAAWPEFEEALSLTSSQRTQLAAELAAAAAAAATATAAPAAAGSSAAGKGDGAASPATAAAAVSLLAVAAGEATVTSSAAAAGPSFHAAYGDVRAELVPQMCLLLYRNAYFVEGGELDWLKAHHPGMHVVGGASSGAGDLLFSAGAVNRLASDLPASPGLIGLLLCSASSEQAAAAAISEASAAAAAVAAAPAGEEAAAAASLCSLRSSKPLLPVACFSAYGLAPLSGCSVFTDVSATVARSGDGDVSIFEINITAATAVPGTAIVAGAGGASALQPGSVAENETAANTSSNSAEAALPVRRSQRLQESSIAAAAAALLVEQGASGLEQLSQAWEAALEVEQPPEVFVALWRCAAGTTPGPFTGAEDEVLLLEFWQFKKAPPAAEVAEPQAVQVLVHREAEGPLGLLPGGTEADPLAGITQHSVWQQRPGSKLCIQLLVNSGEGSKAAISRGLARARKELWPLGAAAAAPAAAGSGFMAGCYAAAAANARAAGARSGLMGQAVFSCTARGRELYNRDDDDDDVDGDETEGHQAGLHADGEAALVDAAMQQGCPFVGVYCDGELGPPVQHGCLGWAEEGVSSISTGFTSMFAVFGFRAG